MDILQAMRERRSVRSYNGRPLDKEKVAALEKAIDESYTLFGGDVSIRLRSFDLNGDFKPSTYGVIKGATDFFLMAIGEGDDSALTAGFQFEQIVLKAWQMGLGTCWIAGTYKGSQFDEREKWPEGETLKVISPVGVAEKPRLMERVMRMSIGADGRRPFGQLFFDKNFQTPLKEDNQFGEALRMLRLAPSSTNSQPWRVLVDGDRVLFYYKPKYPISVIDMGIGICHFYETEKFFGQDGTFAKDVQYPEAPEDWRYLITYTRK